MRQRHDRIVLHFPGFEPLDAEAHRKRYERSAAQSAAVWGFQTTVGPMEGTGFAVDSVGEGWQTDVRMHVFDHNELLRRLADKPLPHRLAGGYCAAWRVAWQGAMVRYLRHAWRFGLFFVFPFLFTGAALALTALIALAPLLFGVPAWAYIASVPLGLAFFRFLFLPFSERLHTLHLFADWEMAVAMAALDRPEFNAWLEARAVEARAALDGEADEYLITSHSMGANIAVHVVGMLLEREPDLFAGKKVVFASLGGAVLQCALLRSASMLRARVGLIARCPDISWLEVHCLTDAVHFYKTKVVALCGHADAPQARIAFMRVKQMLTPEHYRKIKGDLLRVHRQYVLGADRKAPFDFTAMTAGPLPAASFADYSQDNMPPL